MPAKSRPGVKRHEAKRLRFRRRNDFPDVNPHRGIDELQFIDQGDVYTAEDIFEELCCLCHAATRNRYQCFDSTAVELHGLLQTGGVNPPTNFGASPTLLSGFAGSSRSGENAKWKSSPAFEARFRLKNRPQVFIVCTRIRR